MGSDWHFVFHYAPHHRVDPNQESFWVEVKAKDHQGTNFMIIDLKVCDKTGLAIDMFSLRFGQLKFTSSEQQKNRSKQTFGCK